MTLTLDAIRARAGLRMDGERFRTGTFTGVGYAVASDAINLWDKLRGKFNKGRWLLRIKPLLTLANVMTDYVTRVDSALTAGAPDTPDGVAYVPVVGTWGVIGQQIYSVTDTQGDFLQLTGVPLTFTFSSPVSGTVVSVTNYRHPAFAFSYVDANNYLFVRLAGGYVALSRRLGGVETTLKTSAQDFVDGTQYTLQVDRAINPNGQTVIYVTFNAVIVFTYTLRGIEASTFAAVTKVGLLLRKGGAPATAARWGPGALVFSPISVTGVGTATSNDRERRILLDTPTIGELQVTPPWFGVPLIGEAYEIYSIQPTYLEAAVNRALTRMDFETYLTIAGVDGQKQYSLAAYPWLTSESQVYGLDWRSGTVANQYDYPPFDWSVLTDDSGALTLNLTGMTIGASDALRLKVHRSYASLGTLVLGTDTVALPNLPEYLDWVALETIAELLRTGVLRDLSPEFREGLPALMSRVEDELERYRADLQPDSERDLFVGPALPFWPTGRGIA